MYVLEFCGHLSIEVTAGCVCKILSLFLLVPLWKISSLDCLFKESLFSTERKARSRAVAIEG